MDKSELRIIYMGTPDFAVEPLKKLVEGNYNIVGVVTNPDKPAGRGQKIRKSAVKKYAVNQNLNVLQPYKFRDKEFIATLKSLEADLQIIVAFKMLPEIIWSMPKIGTFNLHASLLPMYRGAAPINWAIINGEEKTGVTSFFLKHEIDTGNIIYQEETPIYPNDNAEDLHNRLMCQGAELVVKTVDAILKNNYPQINQQKLIRPTTKIKHAPKIFKKDCKIDWSKNAHTIHNLVRGLSPYPTAWTEIVNNKNEIIQLKIFATEKEENTHKYPVGKIISDNKTYLKIALGSGFIHLTELQQAGKRRLPVTDFLKGFQNIIKWKCL